MDRCYSKHSVKNSILNGKKWHYIIERTPLQYNVGVCSRIKTKRKEWETPSYDYWGENYIFKDRKKGNRSNSRTMLTVKFVTTNDR